MREKTLEKVDEVIETVCEEIKKENISSEDKFSFVSALASLVEARAKFEH